MENSPKQNHHEHSWLLRHTPIISFITALIFALLSVFIHHQRNLKPPAAAIASAETLATYAGKNILQQGGNAFDAAVAVSAALAVVEPYNSGLGGGGFWLLYTANDKQNIVIDGRETAPGAANSRMYLNPEQQPVPNLSINGPLSAAIPGEPAALAYITKHYGKLSLKQDLAPAIKLAKQGFYVHQGYYQRAKQRLSALKAFEQAAAIFLDNQQVPKVGYLIKQPQLARTLTLLANKGRAGFYQGQMAKQLVSGVREAGGIWSLQDLKNYKVILRQALRGDYHHFTIVTVPPPSAGGVALISMLNILSHFNLDELPAATRKHVIIEAMRRAYWDRYRYLGDPDFVDVPTKQLISPEHAKQLASSITLNQATSSDQLNNVSAVEKEGENTTHFSIIDKEGNRVSATLSLNLPFGSGFVPPGTGVLLNDEMDDFATQVNGENAYKLPGSKPNLIAANKRPLSSMTPTFIVSHAGIGILGTPGGSRIPTMLLLAILEVTKNPDPINWVSQLRFHQQFLPDVIQFEPGALSQHEQTQLLSMGYDLQQLNRRYGDMQAIYWNKLNNTVYAASDPRGGGDAIVFN